MGFGDIDENYWLGMAKRLILCDNPYHDKLYMRGSRGGVGVQKPPPHLQSYNKGGYNTSGLESTLLSKGYVILLEWSFFLTMNCWLFFQKSVPKHEIYNTLMFIT